LFTGNANAMNGALLRWDYPGTAGIYETQLLDINTATTTTSDAPLRVGEIFYDTSSQIRITVVSKGNTTPESLDVRVEFNPGTNPTPTPTATPTATPTPTPNCTYSITPASQSFSSAGGTGSVNVTAPSGCSWTAGSNQSFVTITSGSSGNGSGTANYSVLANTSSARSATITIAGQSFAVQQAGTAVPSHTLTASPSTVVQGGQVAGTFTAPSGSSQQDWVGLFKVGTLNTENLAYFYTSGVMSGNFTITLNQPGQYEFRYLLNNTYTSVITSNIITVTPTITETLGFEADVTPRSIGDGVIDATDLQQIERFAVGLGKPYLQNEGQRADCAPKASGGDGIVDATDLQQAELYSVGIGGRPAATGPASMLAQLFVLEGEPQAQSRFKEMPTAPRTLTVENRSGNVGETIIVDVSVEAVGDELGYTFSIDYESSKLRLTNVATGGIPNQTIITNIDASNPNPDPLGLSVRFGGNAIPANGGAKQVLVRLTFQTTGGAGTISPVRLTSGAANQATTSQSGMRLDTNYIDGMVAINASAAVASISGRVNDASGVGLGGVTVSLVNTASGETQTRVTSSNGGYRFENLAVRADYTITPRLARYSFTPSSRQVSLVEELTNADFTAFSKKTRRRLFN